MNTLREIAKFASGAIAFHALVHSVLWSQDIYHTMFGITATPTTHFAAIVVSVVLSLAVGIFAWAPRVVRISGGSEIRSSAGRFGSEPARR